MFKNLIGKKVKGVIKSLLPRDWYIEIVLSYCGGGRMLFAVIKTEGVKWLYFSKICFWEDNVVVIIVLSFFGKRASTFIFCVVVGATAVVQLVEKRNIFWSLLSLIISFGTAVSLFGACCTVFLSALERFLAKFCFIFSDFSK